MTRYILHPGHIRSAHTGQWHYIDPDMLRHLHMVPPDALCVDASLTLQPDGRPLVALPGDRHFCVMPDGSYPAMRARTVKA